MNEESVDLHDLGAGDPRGCVRIVGSRGEPGRMSSNTKRPGC